MDRPPAAPPVVIVVVSRHRGRWFTDALRALSIQDYPNLAVLIVAAGGSPDPSPDVATVAPEAYVRLTPAMTYGEAANDVLSSVEGAAYLLFCHDDVAPEPRAVRRLVEEAIRSNAGVVAPKVVGWDQPEHILEVGLAVDKSGATEGRAEPGELDQEQHDAVRDVFAVSSTCLLVRGDLFADLGGFDAVMDDAGAGVDLCWRAQVAGARVLVAPSSRFRHAVQPGEDPELDPELGFLERRDHLRTMAKCYSVLHLARVLPQAALLATAETAHALATGRRREAAQVARAWTWNLRHAGETRAMRAGVQARRAVPDADLRRLQARGSVRFARFLQRRLDDDGHGGGLGASPAAPSTSRARAQRGSRPARLLAAVLGLVVLAGLVGSRDLLLGRLPAVGELAPFPAALDLLGSYLHGWRTTGLGADAPTPPLFAALGLAGLVSLGKMALLQTLLVVGTLPLGAWGVWRATRALGSRLARLVAVVVYLAVPLPYDALARGRWGALVAYGAAPFLLGALLRLTRLAPFDELDRRPHLAAVLTLGLGLAVGALVAPGLVVALVVAAAGLAVGTVVGGGVAGGARALGAAAGAAGLAFILLLPWSLEVLGPGGLASVLGVAPDPALAPSLADLARFEVGPLGAGPLGWAFLVAAALPLAVGRGWRLAWAVRLWFVALTCTLVVWAGARGWSPVAFESPDLLLAFAALSLALAAALGALAFEVDLPGYRFGWRQVASIVGGAAVVVGTLPVVAAARDGRWELPADGVADSLVWMREEAAAGDFRTLWIGAPEALPLDGWRLADGVAFATSDNGPPVATDLLPGATSAGTEALGDVLAATVAGETARLGALLAPMGVRYLVLPEELSVSGGPPPGPEPSGGGGDLVAPPAERSYPLPATLTSALGSQIDLRLLPADTGLTVYENTAWGPSPGLLGGAEPAAPGPATPVPGELGDGADLSDAARALEPDGRLRWTGEVPGGGEVLLAQSPSARWSLSAGGRRADRATAYGVANRFTLPPEGGAATLGYRTSLLHYGGVALQLALWAAALGLWRASRRRLAVTPAAPPGPPAASPAPRPRASAPGPGPAPPTSPAGRAPPTGPGPAPRGPEGPRPRPNGRAPAERDPTDHWGPAPT